MKKGKVILILLGTLLIGFVLGFMISGHLMHSKIKKFYRLKSESGFKEIFYERIGPSEAQREKLEPILDRYAKRNRSLHENWKSEYVSIMDSFYSDLAPILKAKQLEELDRWKHYHHKKKKYKVHKNEKER